MRFYSSRLLMKKSSLPSEYQEVEYIASSGTQYIKTGFIPTLQTKVEMDSQLTQTSNNYTFLFGTRSETHDLNGRYEFLTVQATGSYSVSIGNNNDIRTYPNTVVSDTNRHTFIIDAPNHVGTVDGVECTRYDGEYTAFTPSTAPLVLFTTTYGNSVQNALSVKMKLYSTKIWENGVLQRNFVPCYRRSDNVIGLYDTANNTFYTNAGAGVFSKGGNV